MYIAYSVLGPEIFEKKEVRGKEGFKNKDKILQAAEKGVAEG